MQKAIKEAAKRNDMTSAKVCHLDLPFFCCDFCDKISSFFGSLNPSRCFLGSLWCI